MAHPPWTSVGPYLRKTSLLQAKKKGGGRRRGVQHCAGSAECEVWRVGRWKTLEGKCRWERDDERANGEVNRAFLQRSLRQSFTVMWSTFLAVVDI